MARSPRWSSALTRPLAASIPSRVRPAAVRLIKAIHTAAFVTIGGSILLFTWDAVRRHSGRRTSIAAAIGIAESVVFASNDFVCPLTPLAEELGADSGSITDIYLPRCVSERIPVIGGSVLLLGLTVRVVRWRR